MSLSTYCQSLLAREIALFNDEYDEHFLSGESKPNAIGKPYLLHRDDSRKGVLLIHGLMAAPEEVREWADFLFGQGYTVYAPRMAGHGTSADDLSQRTVKEWIASVDRGHEILKQCCDTITVAGFSTGGAIALQQAISKPNDFDCLISISAPLKFKKFSAHFAKPVHAWNTLLNSLNIRRGKKEFVTNHADNPHINYLRCPVSSIVQIKHLMAFVSTGLESIKMPTLILHGSDDPKVDVRSSREIFDRISANQKIHKEIQFHLHGIIRNDIAKEVFKEVDAFLKAIGTATLPENLSAGSSIDLPVNP